MLHNDEKHFGAIAKLFHWGMALLILGMLGIGLYMTSLSVSPEKLKLYRWHKEYGFIVLALVTCRLVWRLLETTPQLSIPLLEKIAVRVVHWLLYALMFIMPVSGWLLTSAAGFPVSFFGLFTIPVLIPADDSSRILFQSIHHWSAYSLIALVLLHTAAAFKHHFIDKDDILRRMF